MKMYLLPLHRVEKCFYFRFHRVAEQSTQTLDPTHDSSWSLIMLPVVSFPSTCTQFEHPPNQLHSPPHFYMCELMWIKLSFTFTSLSSSYLFYSFLCSRRDDLGRKKTPSELHRVTVNVWSFAVSELFIVIKSDGGEWRKKFTILMLLLLLLVCGWYKMLKWIFHSMERLRAFIEDSRLWSRVKISFDRQIMCKYTLCLFLIRCLFSSHFNQDTHWVNMQMIVRQHGLKHNKISWSERERGRRRWMNF